MVFQKLTDMSAQSLQSFLAGNTIAIYYKKDTDATSDIPRAAVSLDFSERLLTKDPQSGAKYAYTLIINHILGCCKAGTVSRISRYDFVDYGNAANALDDLEMTYFSKNIYDRMEAMAAGPLIASVIGEVYTEFNDEKGSWVRAVAVNGIANAKFLGNLSMGAIDRYYAGMINKEFDDDVRRALAGLKADAQANREGSA